MPNPNPKGKTYLLKGVPVDLYEAAQQKAAENRPPLSMRWVFISLLEKWVGKRPPSADPKPKIRTEPPKKRGRKPRPLSARDAYRAATRMDADAGPPEPITDDSVSDPNRQTVDDDGDDLDLNSVF